MDYFIEHLMDGLTLGAICAVLALSYAIASGARHSLIFVNTAFYLTGIAISLAVFSGAAASGFHPGEALSAVLALIWVMAAAAIAAGAATEALPAGIKSCLRPHALMVSLAALFIAAGILQVADQLRIPQYLLPAFTPRLTLFIPGILRAEFASVEPVIIALGAAVLGAIIYLFRHGSFGRKQRAVAQDRRVAELLGLDVARIVSVTIIIASIAAALSGWMAALASQPAGTGNVLFLAVCTFLGAVSAGLHSLPKSAAGGFAVGLGEALWSGYFGPDYAWPAIFAILVFILIFSRPAFATGPAMGDA